MQDLSSLFEQSRARPDSLESATQQTWKHGPASPVLWQNEVHIWRANLDAARPKHFHDALAPEDRMQAARYRFDVDRRRFGTARASLRLILSRYLETGPAALQFELGAYGKPRLANEQNKYGIRFNLSHSGELALIAIARYREVGVDIEFMRPDFAIDEVAEHFFSAAEVKKFCAIAPELKTQAFFNCWTRKEAYIKARGEGLSFPLDQFDVSLAPNAPAALLGNRLDRAEVSRWSFHDLFPNPGYAAALAVEGAFSRMLLWDFNPA